MASDPHRANRIQWGWFVAALALVGLHTALAYGHLERLDEAEPVEASSVNRVIALHGAAGFSGLLLLLLAAERGSRERSLRRELHDVRESSRSRFRSVLDALPTQVALLDGDGVIVETNEAWRRFASVAATPGDQRGVGARYADTYTDDGSPDGSDIAAGVAAVVHGDRARYTSEHQCAGTPPVWLQMHVAALQGQQRVKAVVAEEDVSTRLASEALTQKQSDQLRRLASLANSVSGAQDVRSVLNLIASGACELVDAGVAAMHVAAGDAESLDLDVEARITEGCRPTLRTGRSEWRAAPCGSLAHPMSLTREGLEGSPEWRAFLDTIGYVDAPAGWLGAPLLGLDGRHLGALHLIARQEPFTEQDASIVAQMARLAAGAIENAWLYQELREGDRRKDEFIATLAHELRNPLAPMRSALEIIKRAPDDAARRTATGVLERQVLHMVRLIDDLLDISRITRLGWSPAISLHDGLAQTYSWFRSECSVRQ